MKTTTNSVNSMWAHYFGLYANAVGRGDKEAAARWDEQLKMLEAKVAKDAERSRKAA